MSEPIEFLDVNDSSHACVAWSSPDEAVGSGPTDIDEVDQRHVTQIGTCGLRYVQQRESSNDATKAETASTLAKDGVLAERRAERTTRAAARLPRHRVLVVTFESLASSTNGT